MPHRKVMAQVLKASYHQATIHGAQTMAKQLGGTRNSTPIPPANQPVDKNTATANAVLADAINACRPNYSQGAAAKPGPDNTKVTNSTGVGAAFNPCRS